MWPFVRVGAMMSVAPVFGTKSMPVRTRIALALAVTFVLVPLIPAAPSVDPLSIKGLFITLHQVLIGLAIGFALQMVFCAVVLGAQKVAMSMGLGFASMIDPEHGAQVPVLSQFYLIIAILVFIALNGHLRLIELLADSFQSIPVASSGISREGWFTLVGWASRMFAGAVLISLPAVTALLVANIAFGIISKAAPQLNIFAVGFPVTILFGFVAIMLTLSSVIPNLTNMASSAFSMIEQGLFQP